jgi:hypothetical protein
MTGRVFSTPVELGEDTDQRLRDWCENVDMEGRDLSVFARQVFEGAIAGPGICYIMVDAPVRDGTVTRAQAEAQNLRPFMTYIPAEDMLGWRSETVDNITRITQVRISEAVSEPDPTDEFGTKDISQVRVLDLTPAGVQTRIFRRAAGSQEEWVETGPPTIVAMDEITIAPVYANRTAFFEGQPLLDDLADINIAHWQSQSDQRTILHFARVPILFGSGMPSDKIITIGASSAVMAEDASATLQWVEHSGHAIGAGRQDLKDLEFQMETFGLQLLIARPGGQSATGENLDAQKETSILAMTADQLQDALERALGWMAAYGGIDGQPTAKVNKEFGVSMMDAQEITALLSAVNSGMLSRETFIGELARRGAIRPETVVDEELQRIEDDNFRGSEDDETGGMPN